MSDARITPPAQVTASTRRAMRVLAPPGKNRPLFAPVAKEDRNEISDPRRPTNELRSRLVSEANRGVTSFKPDLPAEKRGVVNVTAEFCGDPPAGRREMLEAQRKRETTPASRGHGWS